MLARIVQIHHGNWEKQLISTERMGDEKSYAPTSSICIISRSGRHSSSSLPPLPPVSSCRRSRRVSCLALGGGSARGRHGGGQFADPHGWARWPRGLPAGDPLPCWRGRWSKRSERRWCRVFGRGSRLVLRRSGGPEVDGFGGSWGPSPPIQKSGENLNQRTWGIE